MRPVLLDGATGTRLWALAEAAGWERTPTWRYNLEHPELVKQVTGEYIAAGSDVICSNTFAINGVELRRHGPAPEVAEVAAAGVRLAKEAVAGTGVKVALDIGQLPAMLEPCGEMTAEKAGAYYAEVLSGGMSEAPDMIFFETFTDLRQMAAAVAAARDCAVPVLCSMTFGKDGRTMMGDSPADIAAALEPMGIAALGINCSFGPGPSLAVIEAYARCTELPLILKPNVDPGMTPEDFLREVGPALKTVSYVGACCGSGPEFIRTLKASI